MADAHEYRVIRRHPDEPDEVIIPPTEDHHHALATHAWWSMDGDVELQVRRVGSWKSMPMPSSDPAGPMTISPALASAMVDALVAMAEPPSSGGTGGKGSGDD